MTKESNDEQNDPFNELSRFDQLRLLSVLPLKRVLDANPFRKPLYFFIACFIFQLFAFDINCIQLLYFDVPEQVDIPIFGIMHVNKEIQYDNVFALSVILYRLFLWALTYSVAQYILLRGLLMPKYQHQRVYGHILMVVLIGSIALYLVTYQVCQHHGLDALPLPFGTLW